jgi:hypothetical protein
MQQAQDISRAIRDGVCGERDNVYRRERRGQSMIPRDGAGDYLGLGRGTSLSSPRTGFTHAVAALCVPGLEVNMSAGSLARGAELFDAAGGVLDVSADQARGLDGVCDGVRWDLRGWSIREWEEMA